MDPVVVIGAGPAGLLAAGHAAELGMPVILLEKKPAPGRKLLLTGSGHCNVTNVATLDSFIEHYFDGGRFLYPAFHAFFRPELLALLERYGAPCQADQQGKYFPLSNQAGDVLAALTAFNRQTGVRLLVNCPVHELLCNSRRQLTGVATSQGVMAASAVILAAGGSSYPGTGSNGDGCRLAAAAGHQITPLRPALVPMDIEQGWVSSLAGVSLQQVDVRLERAGKMVAHTQGDILMTHSGLSGPAIMRLSRYLPAAAEDMARQQWQLRLNLLPAAKDLLSLIRRQLQAAPRQQIKNALSGLLPQRLLESLLTVADIPADLVAAQASPGQLATIARIITDLTLSITGTRGYKEAMVTAGGVSRKEVVPQTMASRLVAGLYFAGEVLDIDGDTGGYNLQAAFSTGWLAAASAVSQIRI